MSTQGQTDQFELRCRLAQTEILYEAGLALSESLDFTCVADELLQRALAMVDARSGLLMVRGGDGGAIEIIGRAGVEGDEGEILQLPEVERAWRDNTAVQRDRETSSCRYLCILPLE